MAGTGKSTIALTVAHQLRQLSYPVSSYFFRRGFGEQAHARKLIPTIIRQLAQGSVEVRRQIIQIIQQEPDLGLSSISDQFKRLLLDPFENICISRNLDEPFIIIIDAMDECEEEDDISLLLYLLSNPDMLKTNVRIVLTSRPELCIRLGFESMPNILYEDLALHDVPRALVDNDIKTYLEHELGKIQINHKLPSDWPEEGKVSNMVKSAAGLFIFASTAIRYIGGSRQADPEERLNEVCKTTESNSIMTKQLDQMYTVMLQNSAKGEYSKQEYQQIRIRFQRTIGTIVTLLDPLSVEALSQLLGETELKQKRRIAQALEPFHAILNIPPEGSDTPIQTLHLSFRDFLTDQDRCRDEFFWVDKIQAHARLASDCIQLMSSSLHKNICGLRSIGVLYSEISQTDIDRSIPSSLKYACRYWLEHLSHAGIDLVQPELIDKFLRKHFLHWLEVMSLIGKINETCAMLRVLENMVVDIRRRQGNAPWIDFILDCQKFLSTHRYIITSAPLQVYVSALVFGPSRSLVRQCFKDAVPKWVDIQPPPSEDWDSCFQLLQGHTQNVSQVLFSPDGCLLATASYDYSIRLWEVSSGDCRATLVGHTEIITELRFSTDGHFLGSASYATARLWDIRSGYCISTLTKHKQSVASIHFSPETTLIATIRTSSNLQLWDVRERSFLHNFELDTTDVEMAQVFVSPSAKVMALFVFGCRIIKLWKLNHRDSYAQHLSNDTIRNIFDFSPDEKLLAYAINSGIVLLNVLDGKSKAVLATQSDSFRTQFSSDSSTIVTASHYEIRVWDCEVAQCLKVLSSTASAYIFALSCSPDLSNIASGHENGEVIVWDKQQSCCVARITAHSSWINTVKFSPDGSLLVSASADDTVRVWEVGTVKQAQLSMEQVAVESFELSADGTLAIIVQQGGKICVWDTLGGRCLASESSSRDGMWCKPIFAPDAQSFALGLFDGGVQLWKSDLSYHHSIIIRENKRVHSLSFSHDGKTLAACFDDGSTFLADIETGRCLGVPHVKVGSNHGLAFSFDNQKLLSFFTGVSPEDFGSTLYIWDVSTLCCDHQLHFDVEWDYISAISARSFEIAYQCLGRDGNMDIRVYNLETGQDMVKHSMPNGHYNIVLCDKHEQLSVDGMAVFSLTEEISSDPKCGMCQSNAISKYHGEDWVRINSRRVLWLPSEYKPDNFEIRGNTAGISTHSGRLAFLHFNFEDEDLLNSLGLDSDSEDEQHYGPQA